MNLGTPLQCCFFSLTSTALNGAITGDIFASCCGLVTTYTEHVQGRYIYVCIYFLKVPYYPHLQIFTFSCQTLVEQLLQKTAHLAHCLRFLLMLIVCWTFYMFRRRQKQGGGTNIRPVPFVTSQRMCFEETGYLFIYF